MKFIGFDILKEIVKKRELTLGEIKEILPKKYNDHREVKDVSIYAYP